MAVNEETLAMFNALIEQIKKENTGHLSKTIMDLRYTRDMYEEYATKRKD